MHRIICCLEAVLASWRGFWYKVVHLITYAINPLYRALYTFIQIESVLDEHKRYMRDNEIGNDMYYSSYQYKQDTQVLDDLERGINDLREKVCELKKKGY